MAYVELGQDNGGILLNLGEGGFAVQSALALTSREFSELRFQVPAVQGWLTAAGRIVWISDSNKEAGIQFTELPGDARKEIQRWVLAEGEPEKTAERVPAPMRQNSPRQAVEAPHRGSGVAPQAQSAQSARTNGTQVERERAPVTPRETVGIPVAEQPPQDFHFTDYSMFAADAGKAGTWAEPVRRPGSWRRVVFGVLVAVLFFGLGATVGRETVERWIVDAAGWTQNQVSGTPNVTPPAPPPAAPAGSAEANSGAKSATDDAHTGAEDGANPSSGSTAASGDAKTPIAGNENTEAPASKTETAKGGSATETRKTTDSTPGRAVAAARPRRSTDSVVPRDNRETNSAPEAMTSEHSILVNAPGPGSPPFFVNLPGEAVSASGAIAISARRTLEILPRAAGFGSERVVIGKLISHSEPFYPPEARKQHLEGNVELQARVGRTGQIINVIPVSGPRLLSSAAMAAVREWRYEPTFVNGDPAETLAEITVVFRLR